MYIAQALLEKKRLENHLQRLWGRIIQWNSVVEGNNRVYDPDSLLSEINKTNGKLLELKMAIFAASSSIKKKIHERNELLRFVACLNALVSGPEKTTELGKNDFKSVVISQLERDELIKQTELTIDKLSIEIEQFNYKHTIN